MISQGSKGKMKASGIEWECLEMCHSLYGVSVRIKTKQVPVQEYWIAPKDLEDASVVETKAAEPETKKNSLTQEEIEEMYATAGIPNFII